MVRAVRQQQPDAVFHLGDCERDTQRLEKEFPDLPLYRVCGNCDREPVNPEVLQCTLDGVKFFCTHGDRYGVKYTLDALLNAAYFAGADIVLFGHTHRALSETMSTPARRASARCAPTPASRRETARSAALASTPSPRHENAPSTLRGSILLLCLLFAKRHIERMVAVDVHK